MNTLEWLKPVTLGVLIGAVAVSAVGFSLGGWVTGGNATIMANTQSRDEVIAALVPVCVDLSHTDAERLAKLEKIRETAAYQRRNALMETGWAIVPGSDSSDRDLAKACLDALELDKS